MPRPPKYPLEPLLDHRERKVGDATAELGGAVRRREGAEAARARAERTKREAEERADAVRRAEAARLVGGELRAVDLARAQAWEVAASAEASELARVVERTVEEVATARAGEEQARADLAQKKAEHDVVQKDKGRFEDGRRRAAEAAAEENAAEAWRDRRDGRGGR